MTEPKLSEKEITGKCAFLFSSISSVLVSDVVNCKVQRFSRKIRLTEEVRQ
jgi:hypothetical protein